jgi:chromosome segregation ATPase
MATTSQQYEAQLAQLDATIERHRERDREINNAIGAALADGKDAGALRDERRELREALEDLHATRPHIEQRLAAARRAEAEAGIESALSEAAGTRKRALELVAPIFGHMQEALAAVDEVERMHGAVYALATGRAAYGARAAGRPEPSRDFILPGVSPQQWGAFRNHLSRVVQEAPKPLREGGEG